MSPEFFIPPYNDGKKLKTLYNQTPKTNIFSANNYELGILRLLPEYAHIKDIQPFVSERDGRLHFNMEE
jgi:hypothetical protein